MHTPTNTYLERKQRSSRNNKRVRGGTKDQLSKIGFGGGKGGPGQVLDLRTLRQYRLTVVRQGKNNWRGPMFLTRV
jgi:hypothetical protein